MRNSISIDEFLKLKELVKTDLRYRDACGSSLIEIKELTKEDREIIEEYFKKLDKKIEFSKDNKYCYIIK